LHAGILTGVGALFDFWAGDKPRAPVIVQKMRLEWLYRLCLEPRRLARRYTVDIVKFLKHCYHCR
jgi:beta-1,4-glucosyltransferase